LAPEITAVQKLQASLPTEIAKKTIIITSDLGTKDLFSRWLQIWSGEKNIVIGTRSALFFCHGLI
jgi:primosomal protein N'